MFNSDGRIRLADCSFEDFRAGTMGNAGHNLYVSRAGVLQRIMHTSLTGSGYVDLPFANSHDDAHNIPAYLCVDPFGSDEPVELPTYGAYAGAVGDLNGDGYDDIVIANQYNGVTNELNAQVYFGSAEGYSRKRMLHLWAPSSKDVVIGSFAPGEMPAIVFVSREKLRIFRQSESGFASGRFDDLTLEHGIDSIVAADLDGDGIDDLVVRAPDSTIHIYWGGEGGIVAERSTVVDTSITGVRQLDTGMDLASMSAGALGGTAPTGLYVYAPPTEPRLKIVELDGRPQLFLCPNATALFLAFDEAREARVTLSLESGPVMSAAAGAIRGTGQTDVVLASRQEDSEGAQFSLVYWGAEGTPERIVTQSANDVAIVDLTGDGCGDVVVCQDETEWMFSTESLIFRGMPSGLASEPRRIATHCALDVLFPISAADGLPKPLFINLESNSRRGNIDSYVYLGGPDGYSEDRRLTFAGWAAISLKYLDFDDRGLPDVLVTNTNENYPEVDNGSFIYRRDENGGFPVDSRVELPTLHSMSTVVADFNRDGYLDIVACGWQNPHLQIFYGGPEGFSEPRLVSLTVDGIEHADPRFMSTADLNRDGYLDLVVPTLGRHPGLLIYWGGPDGFDPSRTTVLETGGVVSSRVADLDGDGWLDLVIGGFKGNDPRDDYRTSVYIYWGGPEGFSNDRRTELPGYFPADVAVADLNNDGVLDIVVANYNAYQNRDTDSYIYWGAPGGDFDPKRMTRLFQHSACGLLVADFEETGWPDIAIANHKTYGDHPGNSYIWRGGPDGFQESDSIALPTRGPHGISHQDIGNVYDRGPEEVFTSRVFELDMPGVLDAVHVRGTFPDKTWTQLQLRTATTHEALESAEWGKRRFETAEENIGLPLAAFVQYRLVMGAVNSVATPRVTEVELLVSRAPGMASPKAE